MCMVTLPKTSSSSIWIITGLSLTLSRYVELDPEIGSLESRQVLSLNPRSNKKVVLRDFYQ